MLSPSALTEHVSLNLARLFLFDPVLPKLYGRNFPISCVTLQFIKPYLRNFLFLQEERKSHRCFNDVSRFNIYGAKYQSFLYIDL